MTLGQRLRAGATGFDALRLGLALTVVVHHSLLMGDNWAVLTAQPWILRLVSELPVPMFFAVSGFLVAQSAERHPLPVYLAFRGLRLLPALAVVLALSVLIVGPVFTKLSPTDYFSSLGTWKHFGVLIGWHHPALPGVRGVSTDFNGPLWTIPWEMGCYLGLVVLVLAGAFRRRWLFLFVAALGLMWAPYVWIRGWIPEVISGAYLATCFAIGASLYAYRDRIPSSRIITAGAVGLTLAMVASGFAAWAAIPTAVAAVGLGLEPIRPLKADLSYGVYISAFPFQNFIGLTTWGAAFWVNWSLSTALALTYALASWYLIEAQALRLKRKVAARLTAHRKVLGQLDEEAAVP